MAITLLAGVFQLGVNDSEQEAQRENEGFVKFLLFERTNGFTERQFRAGSGQILKLLLLRKHMRFFDLESLNVKVKLVEGVEQGVILVSIVKANAVVDQVQALLVEHNFEQALEVEDEIRVEDEELLLHTLECFQNQQALSRIFESLHLHFDQVRCYHGARFLFNLLRHQSADAAVAINSVFEMRKEVGIFADRAGWEGQKVLQERDVVENAWLG